jgi:hypothetical protein
MEGTGAAEPPVRSVGASAPSPPRVPQTATEGVKLIGGLVVVCTGLVVVLAISAVAMLLLSESANEVVAVATASFSVIGTLVGAYFGLKIGSDGTQAAVAGLRHEAAKAQAFAAHVPTELSNAAIADAQALAGGDDLPSAGSQAHAGDPRPARG